MWARSPARSLTFAEKAQNGRDRDRLIAKILPVRFLDGRGANETTRKFLCLDIIFDVGGRGVGSDSGGQLRYREWPHRIACSRHTMPPVQSPWPSHIEY